MQRLSSLLLALLTLALKGLPVACAARRNAKHRLSKHDGVSAQSFLRSARKGVCAALLKRPGVVSATPPRPGAYRTACTRVRLPASCVLYVPEAQGSYTLPRGATHCTYRRIKYAVRGTTGAPSLTVTRRAPTGTASTASRAPSPPSGTYPRGVPWRGPASAAAPLVRDVTSSPYRCRLRR